ncbi:dienelactone hydrolase family protein [Pseudomonas gingeri]|uniref:Dienelactone hydrolase family protein n=1 Tax=Pseudomonas gingeri TaxID=117681 RepID=A0A7Y7XCE2_9PSED|nr:dienelactone hydrolase family protein [Pseudomonas gingeri]NWB96163.1 dienelactone hydrolase family protein [Pseudomonas gingeri]
MLLKALGGLFAAIVFSDPTLAAITEREVTIPVTVKGFFGDSQQNMVATEFRPEGPGPFPLLVLNHGTPRSKADNARMKDGFKPQARLFAQRGFVVINPLRLGFGKSDGVAGDSYGNCHNPSYFEAGLETARDIAAAVTYARSKPYIDTTRIVLVGQSGGGFGVLALASLNQPGVIGVINFAGGRGSRGPDEVCDESKLVETFDRYAKTTHVPMLWFYSENDHFFYAALARKLYGAYQHEGVDVRFIVAPPYRNDGHGFFHHVENAPVWMREVEPFLQKIGLPAPHDTAQAVIAH